MQAGNLRQVRHVRRIPGRRSYQTPVARTAPGGVMHVPLLASPPVELLATPVVGLTHLGPREHRGHGHWTVWVHGFPRVRSPPPQPPCPAAGTRPPTPCAETPRSQRH